jgi:hypothetical protein
MRFDSTALLSNFGRGRCLTHVGREGNATWSTGGCTAKVSQLLSGAVAFRLWDADVAFDDSITAEFTYRFLDDDLISGTKQFPALGAMISLKVTLARQQ